MQIFQLIVGSGGLLGILYLIFRTGRIVEKIDSMDKKLDKSIEKLDDANNRLTKLEVRVEERTLKVIHVEKTGTENRK